MEADDETDAHGGDERGTARGHTWPIYTIGHSNLEAGAFAERLLAHAIGAVVDVRRYPSSRRFPHFTHSRLGRSLEALGIVYRHDERLGGRREAAPRSPHLAITDRGFRAYADHMTSPGFRAALELLVASCARVRTAIMCAEADPNRCHRRMIADALVVRGLEVLHVLDDSRTSVHVVSPHLRIRGGGLVYDGGALELDFGGGSRT